MVRKTVVADGSLLDDLLLPLSVPQAAGRAARPSASPTTSRCAPRRPELGASGSPMTRQPTITARVPGSRPALGLTGPSGGNPGQDSGRVVGTMGDGRLVSPMSQRSTPAAQ